MSELIAEVPFAIMVPAHASNYRARPYGALTPYSLIVPHITSGHAEALPVAQMWQCPAGSKSNPHGTCAHFVIGQDATVIQSVPLRYAAQHCHAANSYSVGIEHCAREPGEFSPSDPGLPLTPAQLAISAKLTAYLLKAAGLVPALHLNIKGHYEADPATTHTGCPNAVAGGWPWDDYMEMVNAAYSQIGAPPLVS